MPRGGLRPSGSCCSRSERRQGAGPSARPRRALARSSGRLPAVRRASLRGRRRHWRTGRSQRGPRGSGPTGRCSSRVRRGGGGRPTVLSSDARAEPSRPRRRGRRRRGGRLPTRQPDHRTPRHRRYGVSPSPRPIDADHRRASPTTAVGSSRSNREGRAGRAGWNQRAIGARKPSHPSDPSPAEIGDDPLGKDGTTAALGRRMASAVMTQRTTRSLSSASSASCPAERERCTTCRDRTDRRSGARAARWRRRLRRRRRRRRRGGR